MCEICGQVFGHDSRCPNYDSKIGAIYICSNCGEGIHNGEKLLEHKGKKICLECLENMSATDLLNIVGLSIQTVERGAISDI